MKPSHDVYQMLQIKANRGICTWEKPMNVFEVLPNQANQRYSHKYAFYTSKTTQRGNYSIGKSSSTQIYSHPYRNWLNLFYQRGRIGQLLNTGWDSLLCCFSLACDHRQINICSHHIDIWKSLHFQAYAQNLLLEEPHYTRFTSEQEKAILAIWKEPVIQEAYKRRSAVNLNDSTK